MLPLLLSHDRLPRGSTELSLVGRAECHLACIIKTDGKKVEKPMTIAPATSKVLDPNPLRYQILEQTAERFGIDSNLRQQIFGISPRNQARLRKDNGILNPLIVDRLNRFNRITQQAINLFEDAPRAIAWLQTPKNSLSGITPLAALSTDEGAKLVEEILYRTEYGIYG
jgi:putative toxin-antitoxin system antitoxin component (TIGR02293 family)